MPKNILLILHRPIFNDLVIYNVIIYVISYGDCARTNCINTMFFHCSRPAAIFVHYFCVVCIILSVALCMMSYIFLVSHNPRVLID